MTKSFWQWFDEQEAAAVATDVGKQLVAAGWKFQHTGGGCLAWELRIGDYFVYLADEDQDVVADPTAPVWGASLSRFDDGEYLIGTEDARPLADVLSVVDLWKQVYGNG